MLLNFLIMELKYSLGLDIGMEDIKACLCVIDDIQAVKVFFWTPKKVLSLWLVGLIKVEKTNPCLISLPWSQQVYIMNYVLIAYIEMVLEFQLS